MRGLFSVNHEDHEFDAVAFIPAALASTIWHRAGLPRSPIGRGSRACRSPNANALQRGTEPPRETRGDACAAALGQPVVDLGVVRSHSLTIDFDWMPHGTVTADAHTIRFEPAPRAPGLYRIDFDATHVYIGEARSLANRFNGYRNPGGSVDTLVPRTNRRVQRKILEAMAAGRTVRCGSVPQRHSLSPATRPRCR